MFFRRWQFAPAFLLLGVMALFSVKANAASFIIEDIRVEGLQRIGAGTVFTYLPVKPGDRVDESVTPRIIRALYKTGFFKDVQLEREGRVLIVIVQERPAISEIKFSGNKDIEDEALKKGLVDLGLAEGRTFNRSVLEKIEAELRRQYYNRGKYAVQLVSKVTPLERNRVAISIQVIEGKTAKIRQIRIIGAKSFKEKDLVGEFKLKAKTFWFWDDSDQYSRAKLAADLETLKSWYLDRGFVKFKVASTQVSITPQKNHIYITINIQEGDVYKIANIKLAGEMVTDEKTFFPLIRLTRGEVFSRKKVVKSSDRISRKLADLGYAFSNVNAIPDVDEKAKTVSITYFVDAGKRVYVRRLEIVGNTRTRDEVVRREFVQLEGGWFSAEAIRKSRNKAQRLGYFESVNIETPAVPGATDQIDVRATVKEKPSGTFLAGIGFSQDAGISLQGSISESNFLGTGKSVTISANTSSVNTAYRLVYQNPYYTVDGISRGFEVGYVSTDFNELNTADFIVDKANFGMNFGVPVTETDRILFGFELQMINLKLGSAPSDELTSFVAQEGGDYLQFLANIGWSMDSRDDALFPKRGTVQRIRLDVALPGSELPFLKLTYKGKRYIPLTEDIILAVSGNLGYGLALEGNFPVYERLFAGGPTTVRGFSSSSLGPRDSTGDPWGGDLRIVGNLEVHVPPPFLKEQSIRLVGFLDAGGIWDLDNDGFSASGFRYSVGVGGTWLSPLGALTISVAQPLNDEPGDEVEVFQFTFGSQF